MAHHLPADGQDHQPPRQPHQQAHPSPRPKPALRPWPARRDWPASRVWQNRRGWPARRRLAVFFGLAFVISWCVWPLTLLNPASSPMVPFGPALAAVAVAFLCGGKEGLLGLLRRLARWRVSVRWYVVALALPCLLVLAAAGLTVAGGAPAPDLGPNPGWFLLVGTFTSTLVIVGLFEELGWRGYALPLMQQNHTALAAALLLGVVWALWHLPELASDPTGQRPPVPFMLMVIAQSVLLAWIYNSTSSTQSAALPATEEHSPGAGSVPLCMLFHASFNTSGALLFPALAGPDYLTLWWTLALLHVLAALAVIAYAGPVRLARTLDTKAPNGIT
ncbi:CPBP family intramembrane glutamic endopeptidase [Arthrobacter sp. ZGTC131]|uniref:CPBP family intramembrane glutamic endopeptidase n=1 Tax=Arthrobacter sp. ZGTC131 TaxID=2058898 RepID=UPI000CE2E597|nr:CPBP family intramembrane glutamic endopeptidase [Arthrobacter sp. ZGTC131]